MRVFVAGIAALALGLSVGSAQAAPPPNEIAKIVVPTRATAAPGTGRVLMRLGPLAQYAGGPNQLRVVAHASVGGRDYLRVLLPKRPNGSAGWIPHDAALVMKTPYAVRISTGARRVTVLRAGKVVRSFRAVVGAPATPTPTGEFALSEPVPQVAGGGFYGPYVFTLTAFSNVLESFDGGPGRVAIHGRGGASLRDPLGSARSHGCIRVANGQVAWLARHLEPGTPVRITR